MEWVNFARANTVSPGFIESGLTGAVSEEVKDTLREKTPIRYVTFARRILLDNTTLC